MSSIHPLPQEIEIRQMLGMLFGDELEIKSAETPLDTGADSNNAAALFVSDDGEPVTACICDLPFAAFAGAALSMIPKGGAEDAAKSGDLSETMLGNLHEIMNICSRLFMKSDSPHLKLENIYSSIKDLPENAREMVGTVKDQLHFQVTIPGYGDGHLSFLAT